MGVMRKGNPTDMTVPNEEELFRQIMLTIESVWGSRLSSKDIEKWLSNFDGSVFSLDYERRLALYLLANFVYYNEAEVRHLCRTLFSDYIHYMLLGEENGNSSDLESKLGSIVNTSCFCPLGKPGESGSLVLYFFRQENNIATIQISDPLRPPAFAKTIVYVDDATISGDEARNYLLMVDKKKNNVLLAFVSTMEAIEVLRAKDIQVISCVIMDERSKCFSNEATLYIDFKDSFDDCRRFAEEYGKKSMTYQDNPVEPLGYKNGQYTFGFFYNTPDNTLPIFWADNKEWTPIMRRYEKFKEVTYREYPRFI